MLRIDFVTLFPEMTLSGCRHSILSRAETSGLVEFHAVSPRDFTYDSHGKVDDAPYGGGPGMVMMAEPIAAALASIGVLEKPKQEIAVVMTDPSGCPFRQQDAIELSKLERVVFLCGHYEGIDDRIRAVYCTHCFSIGDYVLTGGELPAMVMTDAIVRNIEGSLGSAESLQIDSHSDGLLSAPQFTRPIDFQGHEVPAVLRSGDHQKIARWRREQSLKVTQMNRPDLLSTTRLDIADLDMLSS